MTGQLYEDSAPTSRLARIARRDRRPAAAPAAPDAPAAPAGLGAQCELCAVPLGLEHPHLLDVSTQQVRCACRACAVLFDRRGAAGGQLRRVPDRRWRLPPGDDDLLLAATGVPVDVAFFVQDEGGIVTAHYPGVAGVVRATVDSVVWAEVVRSHPLMARIDRDVEALLVRRHPRADEERFVVPIDDCFRLAGVIRGVWRGMTGGDAVWPAIDAFFGELAQRARAAPIVGPAVPRDLVAGGRLDGGFTGQVPA